MLNTVKYCEIFLNITDRVHIPRMPGDERGLLGFSFSIEKQWSRATDDGNSCMNAAAATADHYHHMWCGNSGTHGTMLW